MSDTESSEDEIEPKLKYVRLSNDLQSILLKSSATCIAVHPKVRLVSTCQTIILFLGFSLFALVHTGASSTF